MRLQMQNEKEYKLKENASEVLGGVRKLYRRAATKKHTRRELIFEENNTEKNSEHHLSSSLEKNITRPIFKNAKSNSSKKLKKYRIGTNKRHIEGGVLVPQFKLVALKEKNCIRKFVYYESPIIKLIKRNKLFLATIPIKNFSTEIEIGNKGTAKSIDIQIKEETLEEEKNLDKIDVKMSTGRKNLRNTIATFDKSTNSREEIEKLTQGRSSCIKRRTVKKSFSPNNPCVLVQRSPNLLKTAKLHRKALTLNSSTDDLTSSNDELFTATTKFTGCPNSNSKINLDSSSNSLNDSNISIEAYKENCKTPTPKAIKKTTKIKNKQNENIHKKSGKSIIAEETVNKIQREKADVKINAAQIPISPEQFNSLVKNNNEAVKNKNSNTNMKHFSRTSLATHKSRTKKKVKRKTNSATNSVIASKQLENSLEVGKESEVLENLIEKNNKNISVVGNNKEMEDKFKDKDNEIQNEAKLQVESTKFENSSETKFTNKEIFGVTIMESDKNHHLLKKELSQDSNEYENKNNKENDKSFPIDNKNNLASNSDYLFVDNIIKQLLVKSLESSCEENILPNCNSNIQQSEINSVESCENSEKICVIENPVRIEIFEKKNNDEIQCTEKIILDNKNSLVKENNSISNLNIKNTCNLEQITNNLYQKTEKPEPNLNEEETLENNNEVQSIEKIILDTGHFSTNVNDNNLSSIIQENCNLEQKARKSSRKKKTQTVSDLHEKKTLSKETVQSEKESKKELLPKSTNEKIIKKDSLSMDNKVKGNTLKTKLIHQSSFIHSFKETLHLNHKIKSHTHNSPLKVIKYSNLNSESDVIIDISDSDETDYDVVIPQHTCFENETKDSKQNSIIEKFTQNADNDDKISKEMNDTIGKSSECITDLLIDQNQEQQQQQKLNNNERENNLNEIQNSLSTISDSAKGSSIDLEMDFPIIAGVIFWARIATYPYWPCIVWPDNNNRTVLVQGNNQKQQLKIHVRFFADNGRRSWVFKSNMLSYKGRDDFESICKEYMEKHSKRHCISKGFSIPKKKLWEEAIKEADTVILLPLENRCSEFDKILKENKEISSIVSRKRSSNASQQSDVALTNSDPSFDEVWQQQHQQIFSSQNNCEKNDDDLNSNHNFRELMKRQRSPTPESPAYESIDDLQIFVKRSKIEDHFSKIINNIDSTTQIDALLTNNEHLILQTQQQLLINQKQKNIKQQNDFDDIDNNNSLVIHQDNKLDVLENKQIIIDDNSYKINFEDAEFKNFYEFLKSYVLCGTESSNNSLENVFKLHVEQLWLLRNKSKQHLNRNHLNDVATTTTIIERNIFSPTCRSARRLSHQMKKLSEQLLGGGRNSPISESSIQPNISNENVKKKRGDMKSRPIDTVIDDILELQKNYLFKGLNREPICKVCKKPSNLVKCAGTCQSWLHSSCPTGKNDDDKSNRENIKSLSVQQQTEIVHITGDNVLNKVSSEGENNKNEPATALIPFIETIATTTTTTATVTSNVASNSDKSIIYCIECKSGAEPSCFVCDKNDSNSSERIRCHISHCGKYFHTDCLKYWPQARLTKSKAKIESLLCPRHTCHTCICENPRSKFLHISNSRTNLAKCIQCPATYHIDSFCIPAGTQFLTATEIICPRHYEKSQKKIVNANWCFICAAGGSLVCCETCPTAFHIECLKIPIKADEGYICEECETGRLPLYGELVWAKLSHFRWWPAIIIPPPEVPMNIARKKHSPNEFCVRFFGSNDHAWICRNKVFLYQEGDWGITSNKTGIDVAYKNGLEEARRIFSEIQIKRLQIQGNNNDKEKRLTPPPYIKIKTNRPVPPVKLQELDISELTACYCNQNDESPCGPNSNCLNRILFTECNPKVCPAGSKCQNQMFEKRLYPNLKISSTNGKGWGLKCTETILSGTFVIEYVGEIIDDEEFKRRIAQKQEEHDEHYYFLTLENNYVIDAGPKGNLARFMNHSCEPNCETQKWNVNGVTRIGLFAIKDIPPNTELTFNYNLQCIDDVKKVCYCGAEKCTGFIGAKYKEPILADEPAAKKRKTSKKKNSVKKIRKTKKSEPKSSTVEPSLKTNNSNVSST